MHRDVSPQNILVGFDGGVKVIDFGVAKAAGSASNTATGVLKGKYPYMSPEQANGQPVDARSDLFALGVVLWEMLTGRRLFKGESDLMTLRLVRDCQVPPPSQLNPKLPPGVDELVLQALAPTPQGRYPDCGAFRLAIEDYILQYRLPASNAHLSAYLRDLYTERISREADPANLDQLAEDSDLDSKSNPSRSSVRSLSQQPGQRGPSPASTGTPVVPPPRPLTNAKHTLSMPPVPEPKRPFPLMAVLGGVGALLVCAGAAIVMLRQQPAVSPQVPEPPPVVQTQPPPAPGRAARAGGAPPAGEAQGALGAGGRAGGGGWQAPRRDAHGPAAHAGCAAGAGGAEAGRLRDGGAPGVRRRCARGLGEAHAQGLGAEDTPQPGVGYQEGPLTSGVWMAVA